MRYLKPLLITLGLTLVFSLPGTISVSAISCPAGTSQSQCDACSGLGQLGGTHCSSDPTTGSPGQNRIAALAKTIVNIISFIAGIAAVIMIVAAGVRLVTSGGSSEGVSSAKNMIIYAIIGLVVLALSQALVHFVLNAILNNDVSQKPAAP